jgi:hypothetical protein
LTWIADEGGSAIAPVGERCASMYFGSRSPEVRGSAILILRVYVRGHPRDAARPGYRERSQARLRYGAAPTPAAPDTPFVLATLSRALTVEAMAGRFHGNDERIDVESLALTTQA